MDMCATDDQIQRIYDRLDDIERSLERRLRALELWQAYQTGRLTALAVFFSALGAAVIACAGVFARHFKMFAAVVAAALALMLAGCAGAVNPDARFGVAETAAHVASATAYVDEASVSAGEARRGLEKIKAACGELAGTKAAGVQPALGRIEEGRMEAEAQLERVTVKLASAREEQARTETALRETQGKIDSMEAYTVSLAKDRDAAVERAEALRKTNGTLAGRLSRLALLVAGCAAAFVWLLARGLGLKALPVPYRYVWPGAAAAAAGAGVYAYLRFYL